VQCIRQFYIAITLGQIAIVQRLHALQMTLQWLDDRCWQHGDPVFGTLAIAYDDLPVVEVDILHAQFQALAQPQPRSIKQARHKPLCALHLG
jgi:hypothetical protein